MKHPAAGSRLDLRPLDIAATYRAHPGQAAFHLDRGLVEERYLCAGTRAGKTMGAADECLEITFTEPPSHAAIAAPDYPQMRLSIFPTLEKLLGRPLTRLEPFGVFREQKKEIRWRNGWVWHFASMDDPTSVEGLPECSLVWLNEARLVPDFGGEDGAWANLTRRLGGQDARPRHAILDTHSATKQIMAELDVVRVDRFAAQGAEFQVWQGRDPGRRLYQWDTTAAMTWGTLDRASGQRIIARYRTEAARKRILSGLFAVPSGVVLDAFNPSRHLKKPPADYRFEWFTGGIDWGWTDQHPTALVLEGHVGSRTWILGERGGHDVFNQGRGAGVHWSVQRIHAEALALMQAWSVPRDACKWWGGHDKPEQASALRRLGLDIETHLGRVEDELDLLNRRFDGDELMVHPACRQWREDQENYVRNKDGKPDKDQYDPHTIDASRLATFGGDRPREVEVYDDD